MRGGPHTASLIDDLTLSDIRIFTHDFSGPKFIPWSGRFLPRPLGNAQRREPPRVVGWGRVCEYSSSFNIRLHSGINLVKNVNMFIVHFRVS